MLQKLSFLLVLFYLASSDAAIERIKAPSVKKNKYIENGTFIGGEAGTIYSLLNVRHLPAPKDKIERVLLDLGDAKGAPLKNKISYFQVAVDNKEARVVIDLSQMSASGVDQKKIEQIFSASKLVHLAKINFDPVDSTITIQLVLKKNIQLETFLLTDKNRGNRIAVDLKEKI